MITEKAVEEAERQLTEMSNRISPTAIAAPVNGDGGSNGGSCGCGCGCDCGNGAVAGEPPAVVVNYVVEASKNGVSHWVTVYDGGDNLVHGEVGYQQWAGDRYVTNTTMVYRLVKRTTVITDEVLQDSSGTASY